MCFSQLYFFLILHTLPEHYSCTCLRVTVCGHVVSSPLLWHCAGGCPASHSTAHEPHLCLTRFYYVKIKIALCQQFNYSCGYWLGCQGQKTSCKTQTSCSPYGARFSSGTDWQGSTLKVCFIV